MLKVGSTGTTSYYEHIDSPTPAAAPTRERPESTDRRHRGRSPTRSSTAAGTAYHTDVDTVDLLEAVHHREDREVDHHRGLRPGQLEHHGQGHAERRASLRHADTCRRRTASAHGAQGPVDARASAWCGIRPSRAARRSTPTTAATTRTSPSTSPTASSAPSRRSARLHDCDPMAGHGVAATRTSGPRVRSAVRPQLGTGANTGAPYPMPVDPNLKSPSNDEVVAGAEYEVLPNARSGPELHLPEPRPDGGGHVQRRRRTPTSSATRARASPSTFPKAKRTYHAVTV